MRNLSVLKGQLLTALVLFIAGLGSSVQASESSLVDMLTGQLGVTQQQAEGGSGSIFKLAKDQLQENEFASIAKAVPGIEGLMSAAPNGKSKSGGLGAISGLLGGDSNKLGAVASLAGSFGDLGLDADMVSKFIPIVLDYVQSGGGDQVKNLLASVLK